MKKEKITTALDLDAVFDADEAPEIEMDWAAFDAQTDEEVAASIAEDPDARIPTAEERARALRVPNVRAIRAGFKMTQKEFAREFRLSSRTVEQWEQGQSNPSRGFMLYLAAINDPRALVEKVERLKNRSTSSVKRTPGFFVARTLKTSRVKPPWVGANTYQGSLKTKRLKRTAAAPPATQFMHCFNKALGDNKT